MSEELILTLLIFATGVLAVVLYWLSIHYYKLNQQTKRLKEQKTEFVSIASHQLRGPVSIIHGYISMILDGDYGKVPEEFEEPLYRSFRSSKALSFLIDDYLDVSQIDRGDMEYFIANVDLNKLLEEVVSEFKMIAEKTNLNFQFEKPEQQITVKGDRNKIFQIISNILDNAIKYTPKGFVRIKTKVENDKAIITIEDSGIGIDPSKNNEIFNKFSRSEEAIKLNVTGTGLGLFVAKTLAEAQDGNIWTKSDGVGKGSTFFISIPVAKEN